MTIDGRRGFRPVPCEHAVALAGLVPPLRLAALGLAGRAALAEDLVWDAVLEWLVSREEEPPTFARLCGTMRTAHGSRCRVGDRGAWPGSGRRDPARALAAGVSVLPVEERQAVILTGFLGLCPERAAELVGADPGAVVTRTARARRWLAGEPRSHAPAAPEIKAAGAA